MKDDRSQHTAPVLHIKPCLYEVDGYRAHQEIDDISRAQKGQCVLIGAGYKKQRQMPAGPYQRENDRLPEPVVILSH